MLKRTHFYALVTILTVSVSNSALAQWRTIGHSNEQRFESAAVLHQGKIIAFNGFTPNIDIVNSVEQFDPATNTWSTISLTESGLGTAVTHTGTVVVGNNVWLIGGRVGSHPGPVTDKVWIFNTQNKKWTAGPKLPRPFAGGGAALIGNKIHVFGGIDVQGRCDVNYHYTYDIRGNNNWVDITSQAAMPMPRNHFSTVVANNKIYALGGQHNHGPCGNAGISQTKLAHVFNPTNNKWTQLPNLPFDRSHAEPSSFLHNGLIYLVGGATNGDKVITFDPDTNDWNVRNDLKLPVPILAPVARIIGNRLIVAMGGEGGVRGSSTTTREYVLTGNSSPNTPLTTVDDDSSVINPTATLNFSNSNTPIAEPEPVTITVQTEPASTTFQSESVTTTVQPEPLTTTVQPEQLFVADTIQHCSVSATTLVQSKQKYAANCSRPRKDCDPRNGVWICSSVNVETLPLANLTNTTPVESSTPSVTTSTIGGTTPQCIDTDGDGYGWDGNTTCIPDGVTQPTIHACVDTDGDGYGWNGRKTCIP